MIQFWKIFQYKPLLLFEAWRLLNKWDYIISKQDFADWKHHLTSQDDLNQTPDKAAELTGFSQADAVNSVGNVNNLVGPDKSIFIALHVHIQVIVRHHYKHMNCLRRCLALKEMIERRHGNCRLHIGVRFDETGKVAAHSWLSANGQLLNDSQQEITKYKEITSDNALFASRHLSK